MAEKRAALGRGLSSLIPNSVGVRPAGVTETDDNSLYSDRDQPRPGVDGSKRSDLLRSRRVGRGDLGIRLGLDRAVSGSAIFSTLGLGQFLRYLDKRQFLTVIDLGAVVGPTVNFFGEEVGVGCRLIVEDLFADVEQAVRQEQQGQVQLLSAMNGRLNHQAGSADGVLCWDVFDYLDLAAAESLARQITRVLKPGGVVFALFGDGNSDEEHYTKYAVLDAEHLEHRVYAATRGKVRSWVSRDVHRLFHGLTISETYLLKTGIREMLFRKPWSTGA